MRADWQTPDGKLEPTPITPDFTAVESTTSSFLDELVGRLAAELGEDHYRGLLSLVGLSDLQRLMTDKVVRQRLDTGHPTAPRAGRAPRSGSEPAAVDQRWSALPRAAVREVYAPAAVLRLDDPELPADSWTELFRNATTQLQILPIEPGWRTRLLTLLDELPRPLLIAAPFHSIDPDRAPRCDVHRHHPLHEEVTRALLPHLARLAEVSIAMPAESLTWLGSEPLRHAMWTCDAVRNVTVFLEDGLLAGDRRPPDRPHRSGPRPRPVRRAPQPLGRGRRLGASGGLARPCGAARPAGAASRPGPRPSPARGSRPLRDRYTAAYRDLIGDHPLVPLHHGSMERHLGPGLHAVNQWGQPRLLDPWLAEAECPTCHQREIFAPDYQAPSASDNDHRHYKSLTTGHMLPGGAAAWPRVREVVGAEPDA